MFPGTNLKNIIQLIIIGDLLNKDKQCRISRVNKSPERFAAGALVFLVTVFFVFLPFSVFSVHNVPFI